MIKPKILFYDIETKYVTARIWRPGKQYVSHDMIVENDGPDIISIAYKWLGDKQVHSLDWGLKKQDSFQMINDFTKVVEQADITIAHNGDKFDLKQINTQRLIHGQTPIMWPTSQDTLKQLRKHFAFPSNKLDYVCKVLLGSGKDSMSMIDWIKVVEHKDADALAKMIKYNKRDVVLLEKLFNKLSPFITPKKIIPLVEDQCPACFSKRSRSHGRTLNRGKFIQRRICLACGHVFKGSKEYEEA